MDSKTWSKFKEYIVCLSVKNGDGSMIPLCLSVKWEWGWIHEYIVRLSVR